MYPYRFKTEKEMVNDYGEDWRDIAFPHVGWNVSMNHLLGKDFPFKEDFFIKNKIGNEKFDRVSSCFRDEYGEEWSIVMGMLTKNKPDRPTYNPRKIDRTLESFQKLNEGNYIFFVDNNNLDKIHIKPKFKIGDKVIIKQNGHLIHKNNADFREQEEIVEWIKDNELKIALIKEMAFEQDNQKWFYCISINDKDVWIFSAALTDIKPSYNPKKIERTLESNGMLNEEILTFNTNYQISSYLSLNQVEPELTIFIGDKIKLKNDFEKYYLDPEWINKNRIGYDLDSYKIFKYILENDMELEVKGKFKGEDNKKYPWWSSVENNFLPSRHQIIYIPDIFLNKILVKPSYKPKKIHRTLENNMSFIYDKILYAFDLDDTLVYSTRFEEQVKPLILNEFLTPEIILKNKIDEIGINLSDLKYENGRIYFDDPKHLINISSNTTWVRKKDRVYITQPESYYLTSESMPIGTYNKIVDIYNKSKYKAIITARKERLRNQTVEALDNLGIEMPNNGLFMYPDDSIIFSSKWKANKLIDLYKNNNFTHIHYFDDNMKLLKRIKSSIKEYQDNITLYKVTENNYRKI